MASRTSSSMLLLLEASEGLGAAPRCAPVTCGLAGLVYVVVGFWPVACRIVRMSLLAQIALS